MSHSIPSNLFSFLKGIILLFIIQTISPGSTSSQTFSFEEQWRWAHFTTESGLPSNQISQLLESDSGTIWASTTNGLAWFDGFHWITADSISGYPNTMMTKLSRGFDDSIFVKYNNQIFSGTIRGFVKNNIEGFEFIIPYEKALYIVGSNFVLSKIKDGVSDSIRNLVRKIFITRTNAFWMVSDSGLYTYSNQKKNPKIVSRQDYFIINDLRENKYGSGILAISRPVLFKGIWEWDQSGEIKYNATERGNNVVSLDINNAGEAIVLYQSGEVRIRENGKWKTPEFVPQQLHHTSQILFGKNGDIWLATNQGVYLFRASIHPWSYLSQGTPDLRNNVNDFILLPNNEIWLATGDGVVVHYPDNSEKWISHIAGKRLYAITGIEKDTDGNIWIGSGSTFPGTYRWDGKNWTHFDIGKDPPSTMVHRIRKDRKGDLWFLSISRQGPVPEVTQPGAFLYKNRTFTPWSDIHHFYNQRIYDFDESPDGTLWFGTTKGLYRWNSIIVNKDSVYDSWTRWSNEDKLQFSRIYTLKVDNNNNVWFGHQDAGFGIGRLSPDGKVKYFTNDDGIVDNHVQEICFDSTGTLWVTTFSGLSSYKNETWTTFDENTGLICSMLWPVKASSDKVYIGTIGRGLAILHKNAATSPNPSIILSPPIIEGSNVLLQWKTFAFRGELPPQNILNRYRINGGPWTTWITAHTTKLMNLEPQTYNIQIQARGLYGQHHPYGSSITFIVPPPIWQQPLFLVPISGTIISFIFLIVSYGIRKKASDAALKKSEEKFRIVTETTPSAIFIYHDDAILYANPAAVQLTGYSLNDLLLKKFPDLLHPKYSSFALVDTLTEQPMRHNEIKLITNDRQERWIELTTNSIIFQGEPATLGVVYDITDRKISELRLRALTFELSRTEERERGRLATYLHDTIGQNLAFLKLKIHSFTKAVYTPESNKTGTEINEIIENLIQDSQTLTFELSSPVLNELGFESALKWLGLRLEEKHEIKCNVICNEGINILPKDIQTMLFNAVRELTANVVKHAYASEITISCHRNSEILILRVDDNGKGFQGIQSVSIKTKSSGFGLYNIRQRISSLGGSLDITNNEQAGGRVTISLPTKLPEVFHE